MRSLLDLRDPPLEYPSPSYPSPPAMKFNTTLVVEDLDLPFDARLVLDLDVTVTACYSAALHLILDDDFWPTYCTYFPSVINCSPSQ